MKRYIVKNNLSYVREKIYGWSTSELARKSRVRKEVIEEVEKGIREPSYATIYFIAQAFRCKVEDIFWAERIEGEKN